MLFMFNTIDGGLGEAAFQAGNFHAKLLFILGRSECDQEICPSTNHATQSHRDEISYVDRNHQQGQHQCL